MMPVVALPVDLRCRLRKTLRRVDRAREIARQREAELAAIRRELMTQTRMFGIDESIARKMLDAA